MSAITREQILGAQDIQGELVDVPEWGGQVRIVAMSGTARDAWEQSIVDAKGKPSLANMRAKLVAACAVDEAGELLFTAADIAALGKKSGVVLDRCAKVAQRLNRLTDTELETAKGN